MSRQPLTVSALTKYIKHQFDHDTNLQQVLLKGEVSNFTHHSRGHFYFTLKDEQAQIRAIMFKGQAERVQVKIEDGMKVIVEGYVSLYVAGGSYQIQVQSMQVDGVGELYLRFEQLKEKLGKMGYFEEQYKKPIPRFPKKIAVITSPTGAAIRDIITTIERRYKLVEVIVFPTLVQGVNAKDSIIDSLRKAHDMPGIDTIILGRGGGSIEDLWSFNEEAVAHAIYHSTIPIISAVGHETDFTISDFVADKRAATPTAAAELAVPNSRDLLLYMNQLKQRLFQAVNYTFNQASDRLERVKSSYIIQQPERLFEQYYYRLDRLHKQLELKSPLAQLQLTQEQLDRLKERMDNRFEGVVTTKKQLFYNLTEKLEWVNPLHLLTKGYSIVKKDEATITSIEQVQLDDELKVQLHDGSLRVLVKEKGERNESNE